MIIYTAKQGDTLYSIARSYGLTVSELERFNGLSRPDNISVGQDILLPVDYRSHTVSKGESLYSIALQYSTSVDDILSLNPSLRAPYIIYPGMQLYIPTSNEPKKTIEVNGYAYPSINTRVLNDTLPFLSYISIFSHSINSDGTLNGIDDEDIIAAAKSASVKPVMVVTNTVTGGGFRSELTNAVLNSETVRQTLIDNITNTALLKGYGGVDIDFEYIYTDDKDAYNEFLALLKQRTSAEGLTLSTAVAPKLSAGQIGTLYEAHDYNFHGKTVDRVIIMTYEWGYLYGPPMAVAPLSEVKKVLNYAVDEIPSNKILMGVPNYGYDWTLPYQSGRPAKILSLNNAINLAYDMGVEIQFSESAQSPFFEYTLNGTKHIVWFENPRSIAAKLQLVNDYSLGGISIWTINQFYLQGLRVIADTYNIRKF